MLYVTESAVFSNGLINYGHGVFYVHCNAFVHFSGIVNTVHSIGLYTESINYSILNYVFCKYLSISVLICIPIVETF